MKHIKVGTIGNEVIKRYDVSLLPDAIVEVALGHQAILCKNNALELDESGSEIIFQSGKNPINEKKVKRRDRKKNIDCQILCFDERKEHTYGWGIKELRYTEKLLGDYECELGANGEFGFKVKNGLKAIDNLSAYESFTVEQVKSKLAGSINTVIMGALSLVLENESAIRLDKHRQELENAVLEQLSPIFDRYGLRVTKFNIASFKLDKGISEEDKAKVKGINMAKYEYDKLKDVLDSLAKKQLDEQAFLMQLAKTQNKGGKK